MIGPERIEPGRAPGGLVIHTYTPSGRLLVEHCVVEGGPSLEQMERDALRVRDELAAGGGWRLVVFDGDTGDRWGRREMGAFAQHFDTLEPCRVRSSVTGAACLLPEGHPAWSPYRFHHYPAPAARGDA